MLEFVIALVVIGVGAAYFALRGTGGTGGGRALSEPKAARPAGGGFFRGRGQPRAKSVPLVGGDALVAAIGALPEGFSVLDAVATPAGDIPAVVLGPTGLWALGGSEVGGSVGVIDGAVTVGGHTTDMASDLWRRAHALAGAMAASLEGEEPAFIGAIVFVSSAATLAKTEAMGIRLVAARELHDTLVDSRIRLDPATLEDLREALARAANAAV